MKKNIYLYEKNEYYKIDKLIRERNSESFFKKVNKMNNKSKKNIDVSLEELVVHYDGIFNDKLNVNNVRID